MGSTAAWVDGNEWRAVRTRGHTYALYRVDGKELLFDNTRDPFQTKNLLEDTGEKRATETEALRLRLRGILNTRMTALGDAFQSCTWYGDHWTENRIISLPRRTPPSGYRA